MIAPAASEAPATKVPLGPASIHSVPAPALATNVLAPTARSSEMKSKKEALDDAISATKGGRGRGNFFRRGLVLLRCTEAVAAEEAKWTGYERTGLQILGRALEAPARQIAENSSIDGGVVVARMLEGTG